VRLILLKAVSKPWRTWASTFNFPSRGQDFKSQAWFAGLLNHFEHPGRIAGEIDFTQRQFATQKILKFFLRTSQVVETRHIVIHIPTLLFRQLDERRIVGREATRDALVANAFEQVRQHIQFVLPMEPFARAPWGAMPIGCRRAASSIRCGFSSNPACPGKSQCIFPPAAR